MHIVLIFQHIQIFNLNNSLKSSIDAIDLNSILDSKLLFYFFCKFTFIATVEQIVQNNSKKCKLFFAFSSESSGLKFKIWQWAVHCRTFIKKF